jgi:transposase-like protein
MQKSERKKPIRQGKGTGGAGSQLKLAVGAFIRDTLYETVLVSGLETVMALLEEERAAVCGAWYRHAERRTAYRSGHGPSSLVLGGRRVKVQRPRARTITGEEVELPSWAAWSSEDPLDERAMEQMLVGVSTRKYERSLEALPEAIESRSTGKSAVSRRFVRATAHKVRALLERNLSGLDLKVLLLDGVHFTSEHVIVAGVGIDREGKKHVLGLWEGATENKGTCTALLEDLVERGLCTERAMLVVIDGGKALYRAVRAVFGKHALIQRCQEHKKRNVLDALPQNRRVSVKRALNEAFHTDDHARAKRMLENLARSLEEAHPGAAASLREGLEDLLTLKELGLGGSQLERVLSTTNLIENLIGQVRHVSGRVKRWRSGKMILRWSAAGVLEAERSFRRVRGHSDMSKLNAALQRHEAKLNGTVPDSAVAVA